jgi:hypothetical protein
MQTTHSPEPTTAARQDAVEASAPGERTLILIPIIHTERDMGSLLEQVKNAYVLRYGEEKWAEHLQSIDRVWAAIRTEVTALELPYPRVRVYQDGLPVCAKEAEIVREVAQSGSPNHQLILELMARGATLMGTEDPQLLLQEYQLVTRGLAAAAESREPQPQLEAQSARLLGARDRYIAARIDATLRAGETGLLFLGMAHAVESFLPAELKVRRLAPAQPAAPLAGTT